ncbi:unnamed protein product [Withania somnifera]
MGTLVGHVAPGFGFFLLGIWHMINHIRLHAMHPKSFTSLPWFPSPRIRYLELFLIMGAYDDGTIPSYHLHNFEHSNISLTFFVYSLFTIIFDKVTIPPHIKYGMTQFLGAIAFGQQLLLFHLHSADHMGVEGQYHWLLQIAIFVCLANTLLGIPFPNSFLNSFVRSYGIMFQGIWLMVMGFMLWTPKFIPKGCFINFEEGHEVVRCENHEALERAKSLVIIQFSWYVVGITIFCVTLYLVITKIFQEKVEYQSLDSKFEEHKDDLEDVEAQKSSKNGLESNRFLEIEKKFMFTSDMER